MSFDFHVTKSSEMKKAACDQAAFLLTIHVN
jgi:hypothetical protein